MLSCDVLRFEIVFDARFADALSFVLNWTTMGQCRYYLPDSMKVNDLGRLNVDGLGYAN